MAPGYVATGVFAESSTGRRHARAGRAGTRLLADLSLRPLKLRLLKYQPHRMRDRFIQNVVEERMQRPFAVCPAIEERSDAGIDRLRRRFRLTTPASDVCCHRERIPCVTHFSDASLVVTEPDGSCQGDDTTLTVCNRDCSGKRAGDACTLSMEHPIAAPRGRRSPHRRKAGRRLRWCCEKAIRKWVAQ